MRAVHSCNSWFEPVIAATCMHGPHSPEWTNQFNQAYSHTAVVLTKILESQEVCRYTETNKKQKPIEKGQLTNSKMFPQNR